jgi:hypothetical protein
LDSLLHQGINTRLERFSSIDCKVLITKLQPGVFAKHSTAEAVAASA